MPSTLSYLMLSAGRALLGHVAPSLRAFMIDFDEQERIIYSRFIYDEEVNDFLFDLCTCTAAEIDLGLEYKEICWYKEIIIHLSYPEKIPFKGHLVYLRYEPNLEGQYPSVQYSQFRKKTDYLYPSLFLDMQNALLAKVTPALREVSMTINAEEKVIDLYFFYDGPISEQDHQLAILAARGGNRSFLDFSVRTFVERVDFPQRIFSKSERSVYVRYEDMGLLVP
ncbi:MAG: hypothetical protein K2X08_06360 [Chlamydiales bacterium]|nr:hypothetical protein [Chlamydiales bacterium]